MTSAALKQPSPDPAVDTDLNAYNAAFNELGLPWYWDASMHRQLHGHAGDQDGECVRVYLETQQPHLLKAYEADFLINAIQAAKARYHDAMVGRGT